MKYTSRSRYSFRLSGESAVTPSRFQGSSHLFEIVDVKSRCPELHRKQGHFYTVLAGLNLLRGCRVGMALLSRRFIH